jgi:hypothetical protein
MTCQHPYDQIHILRHSNSVICSLCGKEWFSAVPKEPPPEEKHDHHFVEYHSGNDVCDHCGHLRPHQAGTPRQQNEGGYILPPMPEEDRQKVIKELFKGLKVVADPTMKPGAWKLRNEQTGEEVIGSTGEPDYYDQTPTRGEVCKLIEDVYRALRTTEDRLSRKIVRVDDEAERGYEKVRKCFNDAMTKLEKLLAPLVKSLGKKQR